MQQITGTVVVGFNTRFTKEKEWNTTLVQLESGTDISDSDVIPYYTKAEDGKYYEYYGKEVTNEFTIYRTAYEEELPPKKLFEQIKSWTKTSETAKEFLGKNTIDTFNKLVSLSEQPPKESNTKKTDIENAISKLEAIAIKDENCNCITAKEAKAILAHIAVLLKEIKD